ncbi:MAG: AAA family ATPase [Candidatus Aenigmarchaeota archaeon]|nr:AAA family ATPase [Candidatus Aenigmarchaeota archaeon]
MRVKKDRVPTGIPGLDKLIQGGFIKGSVNLISGSAGTGKTIFGCQFLLEGLRRGEPGVFLTLEQDKEEILKDIAAFGWDKEFRLYEKKGIFKLEAEFPSKIREMQDRIIDLIERIRAKRFVLDSLTVAEMGWGEVKDIGKLRREVFEFIRALKRTGVTSLLISEIPEGSEKISTFGFEEFLADGVIKMHYVGIGGTEIVNLQIRKMRRTKYISGFFPVKFGKNGLEVSPERVRALLR